METQTISRVHANINNGHPTTSTLGSAPPHPSDGHKVLHHPPSFFTWRKDVAPCCWERGRRPRPKRRGKGR